MYNQNSISITPVSNGFVVFVPPTMNHFTDLPFDESKIRNMAKIMKDEMIEGDDILDKIQREQENDQKPENTNSMIYKDPNYHIFSTLKEVLDFLKYIV